MAPEVSRGGFDIGLMSTALAIQNETNQRNLTEAVQMDERGLQVGGGRGARKQNPGRLYAFGSGDYGRLGHGDNQPRKTAKLIEILRDKNVIKFACGPRHTLALTADGSIYSWGYGGDGQLGHGDYQLQTMPTQIKRLQDQHVTDISCGEKHSACLTSGGDVYTWGDGSLGQLGLGDFRKQPTPSRVMELADKHILQISCGSYHTAAIDKDEGVYTWGQGGSGRTGHDHENDIAVPTLIESLTGKGIQSVRCFAEHTMALTVPLEQGGGGGLFDENSSVRLLQRVKELEVKLQREGFNARQAEERLENSKSAFIESEQNAKRLQLQNNALLAERVDLYMKMQALESQLSIATTDKDNLDNQLTSLVNIPTKLEEISSQGVRQISVGSKHVLALSDSGDVYAWGTGTSGQLGLGKRRNFPSPQLVWGLMRKGVRQIAAGDAHSLALTYNGMVYSWGSSKYGQLGHGNRKIQLLPKLITHLDENISRERSSTVRLIGAGARHSVAVLGNGELYLWGRPDFGRLGRSKNDAYSEPYLVEALWRRDVAENHTDRSKALGKQEIAELLDQKLNVHEIERYFPDIESDPEAALYLAKAVANDLQQRVTSLQAEIEQARSERETLLDKFVAEQEEAFKEKEKQGLDTLQGKKSELEAQVEMHEKSVFFQRSVEARVSAELSELNSQISKEVEDRRERLEQALTADKAALDKSLRLALDSLRQAKQDKDLELTNARRQAAHAQEMLEQAQKELSTTRVDIRKHEKQGFRKSIQHTHDLVAQISALSQRLAETSVEHLDPSKHGTASSTVGLRQLINMSNEDIDRIQSQAAEFASDDHVDVTVRQQLAQLLFDNAEMRKQLNAYTEGILTQTMERLENKGNGAGPLGGLGDFAGGLGEKIAGGLSFGGNKGGKDAAHGHTGATGGESKV